MDPFGPEKYFYLIRIQFLGFRYHGWQKQPGVKTIQGMVEKTIHYVLGRDAKFKVLGASRTDAMVSAEDFPFELFINQELEDSFLQEFDNNLPSDIHALSIETVSAEFNIIQDVTMKEYHYHFSCAENKNPFRASFDTHIASELNILQMKRGAEIFQGEHNFTSYSYPHEPGVCKERIVDECNVSESNNPDGYIFKVKSKGFMRHQMRYMMGALFEVGKGNLTLIELKDSLSDNSSSVLPPKAPASGLRLFRVQY